MSFESVISRMQSKGEQIKRDMLKVLQIEAKKSINLNFASQGRPVKWRKKAKPDGRAILTGRTGRLQRTINVEIDYGNNSIKMGSNLPYAKIHQEGGVINMPARKMRLRTKRSGQSVFASKRHKATRETTARAYKITIPARPFLTIPAVDLPRIVNSLKRVV